MAQDVFSKLRDLLAQRGIPCDVLHHAPVYTSQEAANVRGTSLASGAKALICKADDRFVMFVLPADRKLASKLVRQTLGIKNLRFASREEIEKLCGLAPGAIPPFGSLFGLTTYCDSRLADVPRINFNAGDHAISISMAYSDYAAAESPQLGQFSE